MMAPDLAFWTRLFTRLAVEAACVVAVALLLDRIIRPPFWRRALWQSTIICLLLLTASEASGFGRGLASFLFGHVRPERKFVVWTSPVQRGPLPVPSALPSFAAAPSMTTLALVNPEIPRPVWWPGLLWLAGALVILGRVAAAQILFISLRRCRLKLNRSELNHRVAAILQRLAVRRNICLLQSPGLTSPIAFGVLRPSIGLPVDFATKFSPAEQDAMLAHELAHLASRDPLWYLLADATSAALWWHPQAWWARRRLHRASELAADEAAALFPEGPAALAGCLVTLGRQMTRLPAASPIGVEGGGFRSNLAERVQRLLRLADTTPHPSYGWRAHAARFGAIVTLSAAAIALSGCLQNHDAVKQPTLQANLSQSWNTSPASTVWHSALAEKKPELPPVSKPATALPVKNELAVVQSDQPATPPAPNSAPRAVDKKESVAALVRDAKLLYELGRPNDAEKQLLAILQLDPSNAASAYYLDLIKEARYQNDSRNRNQAAHPNDRVVRTWLLSPKQDTPPIPNPSAKTNGFPAGQGRLTIMRKLRDIKISDLPESFEQGLPLSEVLHILRNFSVSNDVEKLGINFMFKQQATNNPQERRLPVDASAITIKLNPTLHDGTLEQTLDAIRQVSSTAIDYSVEDYGLFFFVKPTGPAMETRRFHVDPATFMQGLQGVTLFVIGAPGGTNGSPPYITRTNGASSDNLLVSRYFGNMGINLTNNGSFIFFNQRTGDMLVRSTAENLDVVERVVQLLNQVPPLVQIDIKLVTFTRDSTNGPGFNWFLGNINATPPVGVPASTAPAFQGTPATANPSGIFPGTGPGNSNPGQIAPPAQSGPASSGLPNIVDAKTNTVTPVFTGILTEQQFRATIQALEQQAKADILSMPRVTTENGRQAHVAVEDIVGIGTNTFPDGPAFDILPTISADGFSIRVVAIPTLAEFVGYDSPGQFIPQSQSVWASSSGAPLTATLPLPHYRVRQSVSTIDVWDGQTLALGFVTPAAGTNHPQNMLIFITPRLVDPAGKPIHTDADMPFVKKSIPPQPSGNAAPKQPGLRP